LRKGVGVIAVVLNFGMMIPLWDLRMPWMQGTPKELWNPIDQLHTLNTLDDDPRWISELTGLSWDLPTEDQEILSMRVPGIALEMHENDATIYNLFFEE
jgi:hypothetical protein